MSRAINPEGKGAFSAALRAGPSSALLRTFYSDGCAAVDMARIETLHMPDLLEEPLVIKEQWKFKSVEHWLSAQVALQAPGAGSQEAFEDPVTLVRRAKAWAARAAHNHNPQLLASALCLMGCGAHLMATRGICRMCFRVAELNSESCGDHSQAKGHIGSRTITNVRRAEKLLEMYGTHWLETSPVLPVELLLGVLWPRAAVHYHCKIFQSMINTVLHHAPHVRALLPKNFELMSLPAQLASLRDVIDPNNWGVQNWPRKIAIARLWLKREEEITPHQGMSITNQELCKSALAFLAAGASHADTARLLCVRADRLSQLLKNFRGSRDAKKWNIGSPVGAAVLIVPVPQEVWSWQRRSKLSLTN